MDLILSTKCNLECKHCFQNSSPSKDAQYPPLDKLSFLCDELERMNIINLKISGGEPLLFPEIEHFLKFLATKKFQKSILTNALLINDKIIHAIKGHNFRFGISLDGAAKESHEFLRGRHTFERTLNNILKLKENDIYYSITTTIYSKNIDEIEDICDLVFNKLNARVLNLNILMSLGRGQSNYDLSAPLYKIHSLQSKIKEFSSRFPYKKINFDNSYSLLESECNIDPIYCAAGTRLLAINSKLEIYPCTYDFDRSEFNMGTFGTESLMDIWKKTKWNIFRGAISIKDLKDCSSCKHNRFCINKNCRLKPLYQGKDFYSLIDHCAKFNGKIA